MGQKEKKRVQTNMKVEIRCRKDTTKYENRKSKMLEYVQIGFQNEKYNMNIH